MVVFPLITGIIGDFKKERIIRQKFKKQ